MTEDTQQHVLQLAEGLRAAQTTLDASRGQGLGNESERRRLSREVDILSHLVWANQAELRDELATDESELLDDDDTGA